MLPEHARQLIRDIDRVELDMRRLENRLTHIRHRLAELVNQKPEPRDHPEAKQVVDLP